MEYNATRTYTLFSGPRRIASGALEDVAAAALRLGDAAAGTLVFDDVDGSQVDLDLRGDEAAVRARYKTPASQAAAAPRGRGRPRLGVTAREVTLLPDQWEWLAAQPGGASVALRKLVQAARRAGSARDRLRHAQERAYKVMVALAGDRPGFEEAARSLFANDMDAFRLRIERWPRDIREHLLRLADPDDEAITRSVE